MIVLVSMISFFLDGILSKYINPTSLFLPLFTIVALIIIYPYFNNNNFKYFRYISLIGLLYDITYYNTIFYNFFLFLILGFIIGLFNYFLSNNLYTNILILVVIIIIYRLFTFLVVLNNNNWYDLLESIYNSLILNIIYCIIIYIITEIYSRKKHILRCK